MVSTPIHVLKRRARLLARRTGAPLHAALDAVAREEGFSGWSLLAARAAARPAPDPAARLLADLRPGDLALIAARPLQGKTRLGLALAAEAARAGRRAAFFTLEWTEAETRARLPALPPYIPALPRGLSIEATDEICADHVIARLSGAFPGDVAVIDYLQILDQPRSRPPLSAQVAALKGFASRSGVVVACLSQIDRRYDPARKPVPDRADIRLPNPLDLALFDRACFLQGGEIRLDAA